MSADISTAVYDRWNNTSLNTTIDELYPANIDKTNRFRFPREYTGGSPAEDGLPRAEYYLSPYRGAELSRGSRIIKQDVRFQVYNNAYEQTLAWMTAIEDKFVNAELAATDPMSLDTNVGTILSVSDGGGTVEKLDDKVFFGFHQFEILWRKANSIPS